MKKKSEICLLKFYFKYIYLFIYLFKASKSSGFLPEEREVSKSTPPINNTIKILNLNFKNQN